MNSERSKHSQDLVQAGPARHSMPAESTKYSIGSEGRSTQAKKAEQTGQGLEGATGGSADSPLSSRKVPGVLILEDGTEYSGFLFGAASGVEQISRNTDRGYGEVVFNTSMTGYQEILTDPSYYGQIVCMTVPHIGNTGVNIQDPESHKPWCSGFIIHELCDSPSSWRSQHDLESYLKENGIPGLSGVDTRSLTRHLRTRGVVRGVILKESEKASAKALLRELPAFEGRDLISEVTTREPYRWPLKSADGSGTRSNAPEEAHQVGAEMRGEVIGRLPGADGAAFGLPDLGAKGNQTFRVVAVDFGVKWNLLRSLEQLGCAIEVVPANTPADVILSRKPDGVFLSNGPGDPSAAPYAAEMVRGIVGRVPVFGVCMGHQILSLAAGAKTFKLKFGHRGGNQPVLDSDTKKVEISSHNHGYAVEANSLPSGIEVTHMNLNDKTIEGIRIRPRENGHAEAFSVQYHPEACPGPHDSIGLFHRFVSLMEERKRQSGSLA